MKKQNFIHKEDNKVFQYAITAAFHEELEESLKE